jgi:molybdopterin-guanine dinucleotide biosynthesis protein A
MVLSEPKLVYSSSPFVLNLGRLLSCNSTLRTHPEVQHSSNSGASVYDARVQNLTAFVLAGGKSSRMGEEKAFLQFKGQLLLERALHTLRSLTPEVMIVGERAKFGKFGPVVEDVFHARGPLGGIHAALTASATDLNVILAVDLPFVEARLLKFLLKRAQTTDAVVVLPRAAARLQPLCSVFRKEMQPIAERALLRRENKIDSLFTEAKTLVVEEDEFERRGFSISMFENLNTRAEYEQAKKKRQ